VSQNLSDQLDQVEDSLLEEGERNDFTALGHVRRNAVRLHRQAAPLRAILHHLNEERPSWFTDDAAVDCAELAHRVDSVAADLVALQQRAHALQDELQSRQTVVINRRLAFLSVISAVLLPPTLITGIFGMNVDGLPLKDQSPYGFGLTILIMVVSVAALLLWLRRLKMF
jgi:magnesium transporter/zinc transporter